MVRQEGYRSHESSEGKDNEESCEHNRIPKCGTRCQGQLVVGEVKGTWLSTRPRKKGSGVQAKLVPSRIRIHGGGVRLGKLGASHSSNEADRGFAPGPGSAQMICPANLFREPVDMTNPRPYSGRHVSQEPFRLRRRFEMPLIQIIISLVETLWLPVRLWYLGACIPRPMSYCHRRCDDTG